MILQPIVFVPNPFGDRVRRSLIGVQNEANKTFTTPDKFIRDAGFEEWVLYNGQVMEPGVGNDYVASESGGVGTGFDTITFETIAPHSDDNLRIIYFPTM